ncbi:c-type cytochrome [Siccirubricoccus sp. KC 17139]|uniref:C-type cytochrome n=1 Tax=Siccirubricoccus soli TaxID=2899147 RepID=A0ABT1CZH7_9PROT|nr:c-type cytochrome [Siccirubricoccus soli]MCO6415066.1 c-type cytochrome [Siccirubricoccus soli]MCP2681197.1 c-type cytochrome [Siccirubricoccus soli]
MRWPRSVLALGVLAALAAAAGGWWWQQQPSEAELVARAITGGDPARAPALLRHYGCAGCHSIPGVPGADGQVGPPLGGIGARVYIAGVLPNSAGNLIAWLLDPRAVSPRTAMPATGLAEAEARDIAAFLYSR